MATVYVSVGSNIEPRDNIFKALNMLSKIADIDAISTFYKTTPIDAEGSPDFINGVIRLKTDIPPFALKFGYLRNIEKKLGRKRNYDKNAPRTIDLDIILYDDLIINESGFVIPDPEIVSRAFLCIPLQELDPELKLPDTGEKITKAAKHHKDNKMQPLEDFSQKLRLELLNEP